ncbi:MAG: ATP-dependent DNA helicase RecG [Bdellovibrionaceae bacterium]|nr:ATP-dependent DNA helicase RecG [Pseudobdellovibrionaceae bacterium]|tara:strand:- start:21145 stop:23220 length:2076 start_codon:yes stop_codon:yes gene_type:complete
MSTLKLDTPLQYLKGVGPKLGTLLAKRDLRSVGDLLHVFPRGYEDRRAMRSIRSLVPNQTVSLKAQVVRVRSIPLGRTRRKIWEIVLKDETGQISCKYFRSPYRGYFERFEPHQTVRVVGKVILYRNNLEFHHPDIHPINVSEEAEKDELIPLYTEIEGLSQNKFQKLIQAALQLTEIEDSLPEEIRKKSELISLKQALQEIHNPPLEHAEKILKWRSPAQIRLIFEELFWVELNLALKKSGHQLEKALPVKAKLSRKGELLSRLPFELTQAQIRAYEEIKTDLAKPHPMHRLVQGDVGSGKTLVALLSALEAADAGFQTALMAPTEILAEQHYRNAVKLMEPLGIQVRLLVGSLKTKERNQILEDLISGEAQICVGTHALIQKDVEFQRLGLTIVDEQHRFGVQQRNLLKSKAVSPHFLVMTATPIPRTLAMTVYGDLDVSVINEMPKGRQPIVTRKAFESKRSLVTGFVKEQLQKGRQAYVVCPLVEESEAMELKNAQDEYLRIQKEFPEYKVGLLHGKMKTADKDEIMRAFRDNQIQILVSTTVIEVGVDVPNANIMVIEQAERFGLSQLHQLRGRVGRGEHKSFCILMLGYALSEEGRQRAEIMEQTTDGFKISEADLEMRGPGEFLGTRQSGLPGFRLANLVRDLDLLQKARKAAFDWVSKDPSLQKIESHGLKEHLDRQLENWVG